MMMEVAVAMAANADFSAQVRKMTERCLRAGARVWSLATCLPDFRPICRVCRPTKFVNFAPLSFQESSSTILVGQTFLNLFNFIEKRNKIYFMVNTMTLI